MYQGTDLTKEQFEFLVNWCNGLKRIKKPRESYNLKLLVEYLFFYISGHDMHAVMNAAGIEGDRWEHNISAKHLKKIRSEHSLRTRYKTVEERLAELDYRDFL